MGGDGPGWTYRSGGTGPWMAYADRTKSGDLVHRIYTQTTTDGERARHQVMVTPAGLTKLARLIPGACVDKVSTQDAFGGIVDRLEEKAEQEVAPARPFH